MRVSLLILAAIVPMCLARKAQARPGTGDCGCTDGETCCGGADDGVCCLDEVTQCIGKTQGFPSYPSRCCPRWTIGCTAGSVGCCDPAHPWNREAPTAAAEGVAIAQTQVSSAATNDVLYGLFVSGVGSVLKVHTFDGEGTQKTTKAVTGPVVDWYKKFFGESTRLFQFSPATSTFYYLDIIITNNATQGLQLVSIDAATAVSKIEVLKLDQKRGDVKVSLYPTSFAFDATSNKLVFAVINGQETRSKAQVGDVTTFYALQEGTTTPEKLCHVSRTLAKEATPEFYAGYITEVDNGVLSRVGYQYETNETGPGYLRTHCSGGGVAAPEWTSVNASTVPGKGAWYFSFDSLKNGTGYVSLSPTANGFILVSWDPTNPAVTPTALTLFGDTFAPSVFVLGTLGYISTSVTKNAFFGLAMKKVAGPVWGTEKWSVLAYDFATKIGTVNELKPDFALGEGVSLSGFGAVSL